MPCYATPWFAAFRRPQWRSSGTRESELDEASVPRSERACPAVHLLGEMTGAEMTRRDLAQQLRTALGRSVAVASVASACSGIGKPGRRVRRTRRVSGQHDDANGMEWNGMEWNGRQVRKEWTMEWNGA